MCFVRIATSKGPMLYEFVNKDFNDLIVKDVFNVVYRLKGNNVSTYGWVEVDKDNKEIESKS